MHLHDVKAMVRDAPDGATGVLKSIAEQKAVSHSGARQNTTRSHMGTIVGAAVEDREIVKTILWRFQDLQRLTDALVAADNILAGAAIAGVRLETIQAFEMHELDLNGTRRTRSRQTHSCRRNGRRYTTAPGSTCPSTGTR